MIWASSFLICEQDPATTAEEHEIELSLLTHFILQSQESLGIKDVSNEKWRVYLYQNLTVIPLFPIQHYLNLSKIIQVYYIFMIFSFYFNIKKVSFILFPSHNDPPLRHSLKSNLSLFLASILRLFTFSKYPLPSERNCKLMLFGISPLKHYFGWLKVFYITIKDLGFRVLLHHFSFR